MINSKLSLNIELSRIAKRQVIPQSYENGILTVSIPTKLGRECELYSAITYVGKPLCSSSILDKKAGVEIDICIGDVDKVSFGKVADVKHMLLSVKLREPYQKLFDTLLV